MDLTVLGIPKLGLLGFRNSKVWVLQVFGFQGLGFTGFGMPKFGFYRFGDSSRWFYRYGDFRVWI